MSEVAISREQRRQELIERVESYRFRMRALQELAGAIEGLTATCQGYKVVWLSISDRLLEDAAIIEKDLNIALERLEVNCNANDAADRFRAFKPAATQIPRL